ncbi:16S rRNA (cytidine(1402)-2'-O)-methyltransferase [Candidatus Uhrbacteria bacterium]|nr:16S rRNA (cytidine(1402)-2'-O)-methyltransferase [Candidatus Uhrbacteria bacterium]
MTLFVIATPIGNLKDLSERAKTTLASVHTVLCEDTRNTRKLFTSISLPGSEKGPYLMSFHQHSDDTKVKTVIELLEQGHDLALVTDAGTPGISDPGGKLIEALVKHFGSTLTISPIPGPSAVVAALSVSGFPTDEFVFLGFPPNKKGRQKFFDQLSEFDMTIVFYESTHRILKTLDEIKKRFPDRQLVVCRELTKLHETIYRGTAGEVTEKLKTSSIKGEFVIINKNKG